jgi:hypothetical protein
MYVIKSGEEEFVSKEETLIKEESKAITFDDYYKAQARADRLSSQLGELKVRLAA